MALLTVQVVADDGITPTYAAVASGGDTFPNDGRTWLEIINSSGANSYTATVTSTATTGGLTIENPAISIGTSATAVAGPYPVTLFNSAAATVALAYTGTAPATDLTIGIFRI